MTPKRPPALLTFALLLAACAPPGASACPTVP